MPDHLELAEIKRAARTGQRIGGKYVIEARRARVEGLAWTEAEWVLPGNPASSFRYREDAEAALEKLRRDSPQVASGYYEARMRVVRRAPDDQEVPAPAPEPAPPPAPARPAPGSMELAPGGPSLADLVRANTLPE